MLYLLPRLYDIYIQEPLLDWKVVCYQMAIVTLEGDLRIVSQIGRLLDIRISSSPPGLISFNNRLSSSSSVDLISDPLPS